MISPVSACPTVGAPPCALRWGNLEVVDEDEDAVAVERAADADVVQPPGVTQGDGAVVDLVGAHPGVGSGCGSVWWRGLVVGGGCAVVQGPAGSLVVVLVLELVEQGLQVVDGGGLGGLSS